MDKLKRIFKSLKNQMILMLVILAIVGAVKNKFAPYIIHVIATTTAAVLTDFIADLIVKKKKHFSTSAVVTGLIIGLVISPDSGMWLTMTAAAIAIVSKHVIKYKGRHIFNPAGFGLLLGMLALNLNTSWWGGTTYWLVIVLGLVIVYQLKSFPLVLTYLAVNIIGLGIFFSIRGIDVLLALKMANYFIVFVMLIEHVTSPDYTKARMIYGAVAAITFVIVIWLLPQYDPGVIGLSVANLTVPYLNSKLKKEPKENVEDQPGE